jgi:hypothetical protein
VGSVTGLQQIAKVFTTTGAGSKRAVPDCVAQGAVPSTTAAAAAANARASTAESLPEQQPQVEAADEGGEGACTGNTPGLFVLAVTESAATASATTVSTTTTTTTPTTTTTAKRSLLLVSKLAQPQTVVIGPCIDDAIGPGIDAGTAAASSATHPTARWITVVVVDGQYPSHNMTTPFTPTCSFR